MSEMSDSEYSNHALAAFKAIEDALGDYEEKYDLWVDREANNLKLTFEGAKPARWVVSTQSATQQIWVSALNQGFKFDWDEASRTFVNDKTGEPLLESVLGYIKRHLGLSEL